MVGPLFKVASRWLCRAAGIRNNLPSQHVARYYHTTRQLLLKNQTSGNGSERPSGSRRRFLVFGGGFLAIHFSVLFARRFYKEKNKNETCEEGEDRIQEFHESDLGSYKIVQYKDYFFPFFVKDVLKKLRKFAINEGDVIVASFPKSGTTWVQEIVYLIETDLDFESAKRDNLEARYPYIEFLYPGIDEVARMSGQRFIKTHMPYSMLPEDARTGKGKIIYIARNPKDVAVSNFHFVKMIKEINYQGDFFSFFEKFAGDKVLYGPWWLHVREYWDQRENPNVLFMTYEELHQDLPGSVKRIGQFLGKHLDDSQISRIAEHCGFEAMKRNSATNYAWWDELGIKDRGQEFMRKGQVGDWKNYFTRDMQEEMESICEEKLSPYGLTFHDKPS